MVIIDRMVGASKKHCPNEVKLADVHIIWLVDTAWQWTQVIHQWADWGSFWIYSQGLPFWAVSGCICKQLAHTLCFDMLLTSVDVRKMNVYGVVKHLEILMGAGDALTCDYMGHSLYSFGKCHCWNTSGQVGMVIHSIWGHTVWGHIVEVIVCVDTIPPLSQLTPTLSMTEVSTFLYVPQTTG